MKLEKGSFTADNLVTTLLLTDDTLTPDRMTFWVEGSYPSHGFDDMTRQIAAYSATATKNNRSIYVFNTSNSTVLMQGRATRFDTGEVDITFDVFNASQINYLAEED